MNRSFLKNTTAVALCIGLIMPSALPAQVASTDVQIEAQRPGESALEYQQRLNDARLAARLEAEAQADQTAPASEAPADNSPAATAEADSGATITEEQAQRRAAQAERIAQRQAEQAARQAERQAERQASRAAAAAAAADGEAAEVTTQTVTEENSRSSSEEFQTRVDQTVAPGGEDRAYAPGGSMDPRAEAEADASASASGSAEPEAPAAPAPNNTASNDNDGLSNAGKLALLGLGAYAVGQILSNGDKVVSNSGDRVVVERNGEFVVLKDDDVLIRRPGSEVQTETFADGSTRSTVSNSDGVRVVTIRAADGTVLRRTRIMPDGEEVVLFDDTREVEAVVINDLPQVTDSVVEYGKTDVIELERALTANLQGVDRRFSLSQVRDITAVRDLVPEIAVDQVNFETGSAVIRPEEARELATLGRAMTDTIARNPGSVFLVEGHTDAVGGAGYNLALSDRRAETLALALTEYFDVPPENMIVQGYGESDLKVMTEGPARENRRAAVRNITALLN